MAELVPAVAAPLWGAPECTRVAEEVSIERPTGPLLQKAEHG
jgi:hypothetical protein